MACTTKQRTISLAEVSEPIECEQKNVSIDVDAYDGKAREYRRYLAQQEALRQLEQRKTNALAATHRLSFFR